MSSWGGISSLQFGLSLFWSEARGRGLQLTDINRLMSLQPARLAGTVGGGGRLQLTDINRLMSIQPARLAGTGGRGGSSSLIVSIGWWASSRPGWQVCIQWRKGAPFENGFIYVLVILVYVSALKKRKSDRSGWDEGQDSRGLRCRLCDLEPGGDIHCHHRGHPAQEQDHPLPRHAAARSSSQGRLLLSTV